MKLLERFFYSVRRRTIRVDVQRSAALRTRLKLWFPPKVWLQRSQSTRIGGLLAVNGQICASAWWFEQSILCVLITPFCKSVEPEAKRIFATDSGPTASNAAWTAAVGRVARSSANGVT